MASKYFPSSRGSASTLARSWCGHSRGFPNLPACCEHALTLGVEALSDAELLALVLRHGRPGESVVALATRLLAEYSDLAALSVARPEELARWPGTGPAKAAALVAAFRLGHRVGTQVSEPVTLRSADDVAAAARPLLAGARRERVVVLVCDATNRVRHQVVVAEAVVDRTPVPVREVLNAVLRHDGRAFAVAHNHPSGQGSVIPQG